MTRMTAEQYEMTTEFEHALSRSEAYSTVLEWVGATYNAPGRVTEISDREAGLVVLRGIYDVNRLGGITVVPVTYTASIRTEEGSARIVWRITGQADPRVDGVSVREAERTREHFAVLAADLQAFMDAIGY